MYPVTIKSGLFQSVGQEILPFCQEHKVFVLSDQQVAALYYPQLQQQLQQLKLEPFLFTVQAGEGAKDLGVVTQIYQWLLTLGANRHSLLLNLGGGVVSDLGGFVAATFMRGINYINIPTSFLAQIDAAIGSKTAVNFMATKNLIGAFYDPTAVLIDPNCLVTLPAREMQNGKGELLKYSIIMGTSLKAKLWLEEEITAEIIKSCADFKVSLVEQDRRDVGERLKLNLGHTVGHALEATSSLAHGEAVALGCLTAARIAHSLGLTSELFVHELHTLLRHLQLPTSLPSEINRERIKVLIGRDKKGQANGQIKWILPLDWGKVMFKTGLAASVVEQALEMLL